MINAVLIKRNLKYSLAHLALKNRKMAFCPGKATDVVVKFVFFLLVKGNIKTSSGNNLAKWHQSQRSVKCNERIQWIDCNCIFSSLERKLNKFFCWCLTIFMVVVHFSFWHKSGRMIGQFYIDLHTHIYINIHTNAHIYVYVCECVRVRV